VPVLLLALLAVVILVPLLLLFLPFSLVMRYRAGTARRLARGWVATTNVVSIAVSVFFLLTTAAVTSVWEPRALPYVLAGLAAGGLLGLVGLALSHWEGTPQGLHFTPNRWLVLAVLLLVGGRIGYGFWRAWNAWGEAPDAASWVLAAGVAGSMGAGAVVVGYYLVFWWGVRRRFRRHRLGSGAGPRIR
jgi:hypothetical protein